MSLNGSERFLSKSKWIQYETPKGVIPWCLYTYVGNVVVATKCFKKVSGYDFMQYKTLMLRANAGKMARGTTFQRKSARFAVGTM